MNRLVLSLLFAAGALADGSHRLMRRHGVHENKGEYKVGLNIMSVFVVFLVSALGCGFTVMATKIPSLKIPPTVIDAGRHFGTGVILSTAFAHMLVGAIYMYLQEEVPDFIKNYYGSAAVVNISAALGMHLLETLFSERMQDEEAMDPSKSEKAGGCHAHAHGHCHFPTQKRRKFATYILELGILSHSVFIGLTLGVKRDNGFYPLLVAICFHQFFEGVGLGARISEIEFKTNRTSFLMAMAYSVTTSVGIVLGILIQASYKAGTKVAALCEGSFDAISAGILIYTCLVELIGRDLNNGSDFATKPPNIKLLCLLSLYAGALAMLIIAFWA